MKAADAESIKEFYENRNYQYAWFVEEGVSEQTQAFWNLYEQYLNYSGDSALYDKNLHETVDFLFTSGQVGVSAQNSETELKLTEHFFKFISRAYQGKINPKNMQWHIPEKKIDALALLNEFVLDKGQSDKEYLPVSRHYLKMRDKLIKLQSIQNQTNWQPIAIENKSVLKEGDTSRTLVNFKKRLYLLGDLPNPDTSNVYNTETVAAVFHFQRRHGLTDDGIIGPAVMRTINIPLEDKVQKLPINMERMRWMPVETEGKRVFVNIPEFKLHVYEDNKDVLSMDVVVGKAANRTVIFSDEIKHVVFSPYWNLPQSIVRNEILPALEEDKRYLTKHNMEITGKRNGLPVIRQKPGRRNALGRVKFIFPNRYSIYLHDTPAKRLFERTNKAFSHGCIRVSEPSELAKYLLKDKPEWTDQEIKKAMHLNSEKWVALSKTVPVVIGYFTAWVDSEGQLNFRDDIYGHDKRLAQHLF